MANVAATEAKELNNQGIRSAKNIEWIKVTFSAHSAADTVTYTFKKIKRVGGVIGLGFSYAVSSGVITFTLPHAMAAGTHYIGLVEG